MQPETSDTGVIKGVIPFKIPSPDREVIKSTCFSPVLYHPPHQPAQKQNSTDPVILCISQDSIEQVQKEVRGGLDVNYTSEEGYSLLHAAVIYKRHALVQWLLESRADPNKTSGQEKTTPLIESSRAGNEALVKLLLNSGAEVDAADTNGKTALMAAAEHGSLGVVETLIEQKAEVNRVSKQGWTALFHAAVKGRKAIMEILVQHGADLSMVDTDERTVFVVCCITGSITSIQHLKKVGADITYKNSKNEDALMAAAAFGQAAAVQVLVQSGLDVNATSTLGMTALMFAAANRSYHSVIYLGRKVSNLNKTNDEGNTALMVAVQNGDLRSVKVLKEAGAEFDILNSEKKTAFVLAKEKSCTDIVEYFKPFVPNYMDEKAIELPHELTSEEKEKGLMHNSLIGKTTIVKALLEEGADVNCKDDMGRQPLMAACQGGHKGTVEVLLKEGANIDHQDNNGMTAVAFAVSHGHLAVAILLCYTGASIELEDSQGRTIMLLACKMKGIKPFTDLYHLGGNIFHVDNDGKNALMIAAESGNMDMVQFLVRHGLPVSETCGNGLTAMDYAFANEHEDLNTWLNSISEKQNNKEMLSSELHIAASFGYVDRLSKLIDQGLTVNFQDCHLGTTALWLGSQLGKVEIIQCLLNSEANVNIANKQGITPLMVAANHDHADCVDILVKAGAYLNRRDRTGYTALSYSIMTGKMDALRAILRYKPILDFRCVDGHTDLMIAVENNHTEQVQLMVESGSNLDISNCAGKTAVMLAEEQGHNDIADYLISNGAKTSGYVRVNVSDIVSTMMSEDDDNASLHGCEDTDDVVSVGDSASVQHLERDNEEGVEATSGAEILMECSTSREVIVGNSNAVERSDILQVVYDSSQVDSRVEVYRRTEQTSAEDVNNDSTDRLLEKEQLSQSRNDLRDVRSNSRQRILEACSTGINLTEDDVLHLSSKDWNFRDESERTPLLIAIASGHLNVAKWLIKHGADVNACDDTGFSPLMWVCCMYCSSFLRDSPDHLQELHKLSLPCLNCIYGIDVIKDTIDELLQCGRCVVDAKDPEGRTALALACIAGQVELVKILLEHKACVKSVNNLGRNILCQIAAQGLYNQGQIVQLVLSHGCNINQEDVNGDNALMLSVRRGDEDLMQTLLSYGDTDVCHVNKVGETVLYIACAANENPAIFQCLVETYPTSRFRITTELAVLNRCTVLLPILLSEQHLDLQSVVQCAIAQDSVSTIVQHAVVKRMLHAAMFVPSLKEFEMSEKEALLWYCKHVYPDPLISQGVYQSLQCANYKLASHFLSNQCSYDQDQYCIIAERISAMHNNDTLSSVDTEPATATQDEEVPASVSKVEDTKPPDKIERLLQWLEWRHSCVDEEMVRVEKEERELLDQKAAAYKDLDQLYRRIDSFSQKLKALKKKSCTCGDRLNCTCNYKRETLKDKTSTGPSRQDSHASQKHSHVLQTASDGYASDCLQENVRLVSVMKTNERPSPKMYLFKFHASVSQYSLDGQDSPSSACALIAKLFAIKFKRDPSDFEEGATKVQEGVVSCRPPLADIPSKVFDQVVASIREGNVSHSAHYKGQPTLLDSENVQELTRHLGTRLVELLDVDTRDPATYVPRLMEVKDNEVILFTKSHRVVSLFAHNNRLLMFDSHRHIVTVPGRSNSSGGSTSKNFGAYLFYAKREGTVVRQLFQSYDQFCELKPFFGQFAIFEI